MVGIEGRDYVHPEVLAATDWVEAHLDDRRVRLLEANEDPTLYSQGHLPGAHEVHWTRDLCDCTRREVLDKAGFERLMGRIGADEDTTLVFYSEASNWWACYAYWVFQLFGHTNAKVMDGGREKWLREGRKTTTEVPPDRGSEYHHGHARSDHKHRAMRDEVVEHVRSHRKLVDVRSPREFSGEIVNLPDFPNEGALRGGHIPGARNVPWNATIDADTGEFLDRGSLTSIFEEGAGIHPNEDIIVYCRIGERSSHTWFVLRYLLGFRHVRNYDGSWTEWGNMVGVPIER